MKRKRVERQTDHDVDPAAFRFQAIVSLICGSPWFVTALVESLHNHRHIAGIMLLIGIGIGLLNFVSNLNSYSFEIGLFLFVLSLILCLLFPVFQKAREKAARSHTHYASFKRLPSFMEGVSLYDGA